MNIVVDHVGFGDVRKEVRVGLTRVLQPSELLYDDLIEYRLLLSEDGLGCRKDD